MVEPHTSQMTYMTHALCVLNNITDAHLVQAHIVTLQRQQWLRERLPKLRLYFHCLSSLEINIMNKVPVSSSCSSEW